MQDAPESGDNQALHAAPLSADVTSVDPRGAAESADSYRSSYQQVRQAETNLCQPPGAQNRAAEGTCRAQAPPVSGRARTIVAPMALARPRYGFTAARQPEPPPLPQKTIDGYKLGYRAAQPREYNKQEYRGQSRMEYHRPTVSGGEPRRTPRSMPRPAEVFYNDSLYKPVRDPKIMESLENGEIPDALQAPEGEPGEGILEILPDGFGFLRSPSLLPGRKDYYVSVATIRRYDLRTGDFVEGKVRPGRDIDKFAALMYVDTINGKPYDAGKGTAAV